MYKTSNKIIFTSHEEIDAITISLELYLNEHPECPCKSTLRSFLKLLDLVYLKI